MFIPFFTDMKHARETVFALEHAGAEASWAEHVVSEQRERTCRKFKIRERRIRAESAHCHKLHGEHNNKQTCAMVQSRLRWESALLQHNTCARIRVGKQRERRTGLTVRWFCVTAGHRLLAGPHEIRASWPCGSVRASNRPAVFRKPNWHAIGWLRRFRPMAGHGLIHLLGDARQSSGRPGPPRPGGNAGRVLHHFLNLSPPPQL